MDPYRAVFYNQVDQLPTLDVGTIALCNERMYTHARNKAYAVFIEPPASQREALSRTEPISLSNNRVDTIRLAAILAYGTDEQWRAAWRAANAYIPDDAGMNFIRDMNDDCVGALFYWIRELAPKRLYAAQTAERFCTLGTYGGGSAHVLYRCFHFLYQARFHEAAEIIPDVMLGLGFHEEVLLARQKIHETTELHAAAHPGERMEREEPFLSDDFTYYTQTLADLKERILQMPNFTFEKFVEIEPESPGDFFNQLCAAKYLGVLLGVTEGYYRCAHTPALERVCAIAARLPTDLQHVLALRMAGSVSDVLPQRLADRAYTELDAQLRERAL